MRSKLNNHYNVKSPILFLIFNRPFLTEIVFNAIRLAKPYRIYIAADGPRENNPEDKINCILSRNIVNNIDWNCDVKLLFRDYNLGCKVAVSDAIEWFFQQESEGIILEDDCLPHVDFFRYCDDLLVRYRYDDRIGIISGSSFLDLKSKNFLWKNEDYIFNRYPSIWGWATWRRVWRDYNVNIPIWKTNRDDISNLTINKSLQKINDRLFDSVYSGKLNTWDYQVSLMLWATSRISIAPRINLIENIGFGSEATHTTNPNSEIAKLSTVCEARFNFPLISPDFMAPNYKYQKWIEDRAVRNKIFKYFISIFK